MKDKLCYVNIVAWSKLAEICVKSLKKGDSVYIEGELQNRQLPTGTILEVLANKIEFLSKKNYSKPNDTKEE